MKKPKSVDLDKPAPLVIAFHGLLIDSKDVMPKYTKLDELAADTELQGTSAKPRVKV